jgi:mRNA-degrading endonuclease HigB of HigAB toxin-antitoxin module
MVCQLAKETNAKGRLTAWYCEARHAEWASPADVKAVLNTKWSGTCRRGSLWIT